MKPIKVLVCLLLVLISGCFDGVEIPGDSGLPEGESGSRLHRYEMVANDGTRVWVPGVWFDAELEVDCTFSSPDGGPEQWCLPTAVFLPNGWYLDPACTEPVVITTKCAPERLPKYVRELQQDACYATVKAYWKLGEPVPDDAVFYAKMGGKCIEQQSPIGPTSVAFRLGEAVPWDAFVAGSMVVSP